VTDDLEIRETIERLCLGKPRYGYRRITNQLRRAGIQIGEQKVRELMGEMNLLELKSEFPLSSILLSREVLCCSDVSGITSKCRKLSKTASRIGLLVTTKVLLLFYSE
jgi:hypothetical protein